MKKNAVIQYMKGLIIIILFSLVSCSPARSIVLEKMKTLEDDPANISTEKIDSIKEDIADNFKEFTRTIKAAENLGMYYKMLAAEYLDREMYTLCYEASEEAIYYFPANYKLHYYAAVSAAYTAKAQANSLERSDWFSISEQYYKQAIQFRPKDVDSLFGISVLYIFELNDYESPKPYLSTLLEINPNHIEGLFLLARIYVYEGNYALALRTYDHIIDIAQDEDTRQQAILNSQVLRGDNE